jgi:excinuclease ABC subunit C
MEIDLNEVVNNLPSDPGVYFFLNDKEEVIYLGKAKNLKKRVSSYFNKKQYENNKVRQLVKKIQNIQHIIVSSESDALLLENTLIKKHQPKYNINLKDDKSFPWICIKNEPFPRIFSTRNVIEDGSKYYGPYTSAGMVRTLLSLIKKLYPLRTCNYNLSPENIAKQKFKVCLEFHLGNCKGPCEGLQSSDDYANSIVSIHNILKGDLRSVLNLLEKSMHEYAAKYDFENASLIKDKIAELKKFQLKSTIVSNTIDNIDIVSIIEDNNASFVNFIKVIDGAVVQSHSIELSKKLNESKEETLEFALNSLRLKLQSNAREIILPFIIENPPPGVKILIPKIGDKKKLLELSQRNARMFMLERKRQKASLVDKKSYNRVLNTLQSDLRLPVLPVHIECFDNSNIQGSSPVAACVVFKNGKPYKSEYRHFNVKSVSGPDDFASMTEIVFRRYSSLLAKDEALPQLIIVDGGKGQLSAAVKALIDLNIYGKISIIGIAKRLEEIYFPHDPVPLYLDKNSESLKLIQQLRNEAHRFGINFHRLKRSGNMTNSELMDIKGVGEKTMKILFEEFKSLDTIKKLDIQELAKYIGKSKAGIVYEYFKREI